MDVHINLPPFVGHYATLPPLAAIRRENREQICDHTGMVVILTPRPPLTPKRPEQQPNKRVTEKLDRTRPAIRDWLLFVKQTHPVWKRYKRRVEITNEAG